VNQFWDTTYGVGEAKVSTLLYTQGAQSFINFQDGQDGCTSKMGRMGRTIHTAAVERHEEAPYCEL
jgi:hypothetical protein